MTHAEALRFFSTQKFGDQTLRLAAERATEALREIDAAWFMIDHGWDCESREELERAARTNGFTYGLAQAMHHLHKRLIIENPDWLRAETDGNQASTEVSVTTVGAQRKPTDPQTGTLVVSEDDPQTEEQT